MIRCSFSFCRNGQKNIIFAQILLRNAILMTEIENLAQHLSHITNLVPCYMALANPSY